METNLVFCFGISRGETILAEYAAELANDYATMASKCLPHIPPLHNRFSFTACDRMFVCIIDSGITYFAIVDEALLKSEALKLLNDVRREFRRYVREKGADLKTVGEGWAHHHMKKKMQQIAKPIVGMPQKQKRALEEEELERQQNEVSSDSTVPSGDIGPSSVEHWQGGNVNDGYVTIPIHGKAVLSTEHGNDGGHPEIKPSVSPQNSISKINNRQWWHKVWKIIALDIIICVILFAIWLGVCDGANCL